MTATDELRRMLDEHGVHWWAGEDERKTLWESNGLTWEYFNDENGDAWLGFLGACEQDITPAQAIAATLGKEPDDAAMLKLHDRMNVALLECERALGIEKADGTIVVPFVFEMHNLLEEAATLGSCSCSDSCTNGERTETCHDKNGFDVMFGFECTVCGAMTDGYMLSPADTGHYKQFNFCPMCGRRIEQ